MLPKPLYDGEFSRRITRHDLQRAKEHGDRWPMLTAYDRSTAEVFDEAGIPVLLVGDSAANTMLDYNDTLGVTVEELIPFARTVAHSTRRAFVVCDLPFGSYQLNPEQALATAIRVVKETGVHAVKLEGGAAMAATVRRIVEAGIPVMGHVGFTPQSVNAIGGYRVAGRGGDAEKILEDAVALQEAGAFAVVLEMVIANLAARITSTLTIPTIGIGSGPDCDAQVLVWQDMAGMSSGKLPTFVKTYGNLRETLASAAQAFADDVVEGKYPNTNHSYE